MRLTTADFPLPADPVTTNAPGFSARIQATIRAKTAWRPVNNHVSCRESSCNRVMLSTAVTMLHQARSVTIAFCTLHDLAMAPEGVLLQAVVRFATDGAAQRTDEPIPDG
jgi:hypothetical protein